MRVDELHVRHVASQRGRRIGIELRTREGATTRLRAERVAAANIVMAALTCCVVATLLVHPARPRHAACSARHALGDQRRARGRDNTRCTCHRKQTLLRSITDSVIDPLPHVSSHRSIASVRAQQSDETRDTEWTSRCSCPDLTRARARTATCDLHNSLGAARDQAVDNHVTFLVALGEKPTIAFCSVALRLRT